MSRSLDSAVPVVSIIVEKRSNEETGKSNFFPGGNLSTGCRGTESGFLPMTVSFPATERDIFLKVTVHLKMHYNF